MAVNDPIGDMITTIRNGQNVRLASVNCPASRMRKSVLDVLQREGFIHAYSEEEQRKGVSTLNIQLRYHDGQPVIRSIKRVSKPGRRTYSNINDLGKVNNGLGIAIVSTSKGILADHEARKENVGGEILCEVF